MCKFYCFLPSFEQMLYLFQILNANSNRNWVITNNNLTMPILYSFLLLLRAWSAFGFRKALSLPKSRTA